MPNFLDMQGLYRISGNIAGTSIHLRTRKDVEEVVGVSFWSDLFDSILVLIVM